MFDLMYSTNNENGYRPLCDPKKPDCFLDIFKLRLIALKGLFTTTGGFRL